MVRGKIMNLGTILRTIVFTTVHYNLATKFLGFFDNGSLSFIFNGSMFYGSFLDFQKLYSPQICIVKRRYLFCCFWINFVQFNLIRNAKCFEKKRHVDHNLLSNHWSDISYNICFKHRTFKQSLPNKHHRIISVCCKYMQFHSFSATQVSVDLSQRKFTWTFSLKILWCVSTHKGH